MRLKVIKKRVQAMMLVAALLPAGSAVAAITVGTNFGNGSLSNLDYGATGNVTQVSTLLYIDELPPTDTPGNTISGVPWLSFDAVLSGVGTSVLDLTLTLRNTSPASDVVSDLRLMVLAQPDGDGQLFPAASFVDVVSESWGAPIIGQDPDARQSVVYDFSNPLADAASAANGLSDGPPPAACLAAAGGCDVEFGLQWNRASLNPGETWTVNVKLVDDPSLVVGGRYLLAESANTGGTSLYFGNVQLIPEPQTYAMLLAGLGLLAFLRLRRN